ncbi:MAG: 4-alpha-glucanotransferase [Xanthomonadales bacterium]
MGAGARRSAVRGAARGTRRTADRRRGPGGDHARGRRPAPGPGSVVLQFEVGDADFDPDAIAENSVCYTGTHDNDTTIGWFRGGGDDTRTRAEVRAAQAAVLELTGGSAQTIHTDMIRLAFASPSVLAVAPMQDFLGLGSEARLNRPGTTRDNWRWRMAEGALDGAQADRIRRMVEDAARAP